MGDRAECITIHRKDAVQPVHGAMPGRRGRQCVVGVLRRQQQHLALHLLGPIVRGWLGHHGGATLCHRRRVRHCGQRQVCILAVWRQLAAASAANHSGGPNRWAIRLRGRRWWKWANVRPHHRGCCPCRCPRVLVWPVVVAAPRGSRVWPADAPPQQLWLPPCDGVREGSLCRFARARGCDGSSPTAEPSSSTTAGQRTSRPPEQRRRPVQPDTPRGARSVPFGSARAAAGGVHRGRASSGAAANCTPAAHARAGAQWQASAARAIGSVCLKRARDGNNGECRAPVSVCLPCIARGA
jgi:hypothetical protein